MTVLRSVAVLLALLGAVAAHAQSQVVEDKDVGVRISIPKKWEARSRGLDVFINCDPAKDDRPGREVAQPLEDRQAVLLEDAQRLVGLPPGLVDARDLPQHLLKPFFVFVALEAVGGFFHLELVEGCTTDSRCG